MAGALGLEQTVFENAHHTPLLDCSAVVLAGGRSLRFGRDKAWALYQGVPLVEHVVAAARVVCGEAVAVARAGDTRPIAGVGRTVYDDPEDHAGPLRGIVAGLRACRTPFAFVLACDAPCVAPELLRLLRKRIAAEDVAAAPLWDGRVQPLCALYRTRACRLLEIVLRTGEASPTRALAALPCTLLAEADVRAADPEGRSFINLNTEEDLAAMGLRAGASPRGAECTG